MQVKVPEGLLRRLPPWLKSALEDKHTYAYASMLLPLGQRTITPQPTLKATERPVVLTPNQGEVALGAPGAPGVFVVTNTTPRIVPYLFIVVPANVVFLAAVPWRDVLPMFTELLKQSAIAAFRGPERKAP